jgi:hypothetical protein
VEAARAAKVERNGASRRSRRRQVKTPVASAKTAHSGQRGYVRQNMGVWRVWQPRSGERATTKSRALLGLATAVAGILDQRLLVIIGSLLREHR